MAGDRLDRVEQALREAESFLSDYHRGDGATVAALALEAIERGLITRHQAEEGYFGTPKGKEALEAARAPRAIHGEPCDGGKPKLPLITRHMLENMSHGDVADTAMRALDEALLLKAESKTERSQAQAAHSKLFEVVQALVARVDSLEREVAALKGTPPAPGDAEVLHRALGFGR